MHIRLIYASHAAHIIYLEDIKDILATSRRMNAERNVTGMLCHGNGRFIQYLEGEAEAVDALYAHVQSDPRHKDIQLLDRQIVMQRLFPDWNMGFISALDLRLRDIFKSLSLENFTPEVLDAAGAVTLMQKMKACLYPAQAVLRTAQAS